ncbi:hypothetical protein HK405_003829 [Cladochytrium tenue]|nr:hypothetical protein HK405_003829 [Cladochytrium tenue]
MPRAYTAAQGQDTSNRWSDVFSDAKYAQVAGVQAVAVGAPQVFYHAKCVFDFSAGREDDLSFVVGDIADVACKGDWLMGCVSAADGGSPRRDWIPRAFVERINANCEAEEAAAAVAAAAAAEAAAEMAARTVGVTAARAGELTWWKVRNSRGDVDLVPAVYLRMHDPDAAASTTTASTGLLGPPPLLPPKKQKTMPDLGMYRFPSASYSSSSEGPQHWVSVVDPNSLAELSIEERKRQKAIFELIKTEHYNVRDLQLIVQVLYEPMSQFLEQVDLETIFSNIKALLLTNSIILSDWEPVQAESEYNIGHIFLRHANELDCYVT